MDVKLPRLGEGADSGAVVSLLVKEGDAITLDQPILELESEKAVATIPSTAAGVVSSIRVRPGDRLSVGQVILTVSPAGSNAPAARPAAASAPAPRPAAASAAPEPRQATAPVLAELSAELPPGANANPTAAPSLRKLARDLGIDLTRVPGSERGGRIVLADLRAYIERLQLLAAQPKSPPAKAPAPVSDPIDFSRRDKVTRKPVSTLRKVISRRMLENWNTIPHVTQFDEADITELNALRKKFAPEYEAKGTRLTLTSFAVRAVVETLKKHPIFNASLDEAADEIVLKQYYHIGIAVDTEAGLMVPVIRDADTKSLLEISVELEELAKKARERKVSADELRGGTFTISNQGGIGGAHFTPIINKPELAILGLGRGAIKPVVRENQIVPRLLLPICVSYDHRLIDGGTAARFTVDLAASFQAFTEATVKL